MCGDRVVRSGIGQAFMHLTCTKINPHNYPPAYSHQPPWTKLGRGASSAHAPRWRPWSTLCFTTKQPLTLLHLPVPPPPSSGSALPGAAVRQRGQVGLPQPHWRAGPGGGAAGADHRRGSAHERRCAVEWLGHCAALAGERLGRE